MHDDAIHFANVAYDAATIPTSDWRTNADTNLYRSAANTLKTDDNYQVALSLSVGAISPSGTTGRIDASNDIVAFSSSDIRWKSNVKPIENAIEKIEKISGNTFEWIPDSAFHANTGKDVGVLAHEVELVLPEIVQTRDSGMKAVKYEKIIPLLIEAIKEQNKKIEELKSKINNLLQ